MAILELKEADFTVTSEDSTDTALTRKTNTALTRKKKFFPQQLINEILSRLSTKHLCSFRCVSKTWLNLLTKDLYFAHFHFSRLLQSNSNPSFLAVSRQLCPGVPGRSNLTFATDFARCDKSIDIDVPFHVGKLGSYTIHGIQNGLVCLTCEEGDTIYIWNPFTNDYVTIPCPFMLSLIPKLKNKIIYEFAYHEDTKYYKVIRFWSESSTNMKSDLHSYAGVYTLGTESWRLVDKDVPYIVTWTTSSPLVNGVFHWLTFNFERMERCIIVAFDMKDESFQKILVPDEVMFGDQIAELGGLLCIFDAHDKNDVKIWEMREYGVVDSWAKLHKIGNIKVCSFIYNRVLTDIVVRSGEVIVKNFRNKLIFYDSKNKSMRKIIDFSFKFNEVYTFIGSIISPRFICNQAYHDERRP